MTASLTVREEQPGDEAAIRELVTAAFEGPDEATLVDALRACGDPVISVVAEQDASVVGHAMLSIVVAEEAPDKKLLGLAPMATRPDLQRQGVGSKLLPFALELAKAQGFEAVIVLGHADYYPRFGFAPASTFGIRSEYDVPDNVFMALELVPGALASVTGVVRYHRAFAEL